MRFSASTVEQSRPIRHFYPSLPLKYIEALLSQSEDVKLKLIDCHIKKLSVDEIINKMREFNPEVVVIDINSYEFPVTVEVVKLIKKSMFNMIVIAIGRDPTVRFNYYLELGDLFNIILPGEAEKEVSSVLNALNHSERCEDLREKYRRKFLQEGPILVNDPDALPFPKYNEYEMKHYRFVYPIKIRKKIQWGYILSNRGCPYPCSFCSSAIRKTFGTKVRLRKASCIVDEIEYLINNYKVNVLCFEDDNFTIVRSHVEDVCNEIIKRKINIKWVVHARVDEMDYALLKLMKKAGCDLLRFGVESGSPRIIQRFKKTRRGDWMKQCQLTFSHARKLKIGTLALFILGCPTETDEDIKKTFDLLVQLKPDFIQAHFFTPYPGSEAYEELKSKLDNINLENMYHYANLPLVYGEVSLEKLKEWRSLFYRKILFSPQFLINHLYQYGLFYLFNPGGFYHLLKISRSLESG